MAVRHGYGKIAGTDALVFAYDTGDTINSYRGEPTINYLVGQSWAGDGSNQTAFTKGVISVTDPALTYKGYDTVLWSPGTSRNCYLNSTADIPNSETSTVWTFSCYIKREDGGTLRANDNSLAVYLYYPTSDGSVTGTIQDVGNGWYRVSRTRTGTANYISLAGFTGFAPNYKYYLSGWMLEKKSHPTPVVPINTTRSSTQGLLDLTGNSTIDLTNVSFDSNAQKTFDGTDDDIDAGIGTATSLQRTIEMVFKTNTIGYLYPLACYTRGGGQSVVGGKRMWLGFQDNKFRMHGWGTTDPASTTTIQTGQYYHAVYAYDQDTKKHYIWINGVLEDNSTNNQAGFTGWNNSGDHKWFVGGDPDCASWNASAGRSLNGEIPVFKVYNRILSNEEVRNNYRHYKNRFGI